MQRYASNKNLAGIFVEMLYENGHEPPSTPRPADGQDFTQWIEDRAANTPAWISRMKEYFSGIRPEVLVDVIKHQLKPEDIWKLEEEDFQQSNRDVHPQDDFESSILNQNCQVDYCSMEKLIKPLLTYFRILQRAALISGNYIRAWHIASDSLIYLEQLAAMNRRYEWNAVLGYHFAFHRFRILDMACDDNYRGWRLVDEELSARCLDKEGVAKDKK